MTAPERSVATRKDKEDDFERRQRETAEILRRLHAGEIPDQLSQQDKSRVEQASIRLEAKGGLGTLVPGDFILTATH